MSGFGTCGTCKKKGFVRKSATCCTRCEKAAAKAGAGSAVPLVTMPEISAVPASSSKSRPTSGKRTRRRVVMGRVV